MILSEIFAEFWPRKVLMQPIFKENTHCIVYWGHKDQGASFYLKAVVFHMFRFYMWVKKHETNKENFRTWHCFTNILFCQVRNYKNPLSLSSSFHKIKNISGWSGRYQARYRGAAEERVPLPFRHLSPPFYVFSLSDHWEGVYVFGRVVVVMVVAHEFGVREVIMYLCGYNCPSH